MGNRAGRIAIDPAGPGLMRNALLFFQDGAGFVGLQEAGLVETVV